MPGSYAYLNWEPNRSLQNLTIKYMHDLKILLHDVNDVNWLNNWLDDSYYYVTNFTVVNECDEILFRGKVHSVIATMKNDATIRYIKIEQ